IAAFIIPYIFALNPSLLILDSTPIEVITVTITALIGMLGVAAGMEGYFKGLLNPVLRVIALAGGLALIIPGLATDVIGIILIGFITAYQTLRQKKQTA
ncbi:MAG: TRAP transporter permease, partial [Peptococcaceae bacterium]|nr:TRAP transporter permease [Peptococcaceae bacterium]